MPKTRMLLSAAVLLCLITPARAADQDLKPSAAGYLEARGVNYLVFNNWYDGLFADSKISGVEIVQRGNRIATNGDVRLSATPGQWDRIGRMVERKVDPRTGATDVLLEYASFGFRYRIHTEARGRALAVSVILDQPLPEALAGKAGFNLEFKPSAYFHKSFMAGGTAGTFPLHPASNMAAGGARQPSSGRDIGPGAEPLPLASGQTIVLAPEDEAHRVTLRSDGGTIDMYDGRNQANNGWFVLRGALPAQRTGKALEWTIEASSDPTWVRAPVIGHSQLGYAPEQRKVAVIELDANASAGGQAKLVRINADGSSAVALTAAPKPWGKYLRYNYRTFDFSSVRTSGIYRLEYGGTRTATFRIAPDVYSDAWHLGLDVYMNVQMDHMLVNEAYRVWHGESHRDDALQAPVNDEHIDLYRQGSTTDTKYKPGEHIPGLAGGGWLDAGDFDIRTQTQYAVIRQLVETYERYRPVRDETLIDQKLRRVEMHVPDGKPDYLQQVEHGVLQLLAQQDNVGFAIHGIVEPDVAQYTHLGDAASKTDARVGTKDDRWAFTSRASALNYGSAAALAAAARVLGGYDDRLAAKCLENAKRIWADEQSHPPFTFSHGNTTGGPVEAEKFGAAVELLLTTKDAEYAAAVDQLWPTVADKYPVVIGDALRAVPVMPQAYQAAVRAKIVALRANEAKQWPRPNPYGVPITEGGWAGNGQVMQYGLLDYLVHKTFPDLSDGSAAFAALNYIQGTHPGSDLSFVSGVGTVSKEVAYGNNRADFSFIAGGVVPGVLVIKPDLPENSEDWPFFWGENEYVVNMTPTYSALVHAALDLLAERRAKETRNP
ncbi:glycoside hydrolase family 9 protein [Sphingomonas sp. SM33]|uniref:Glycoside hydrolase family 9 protein n=1 Tax=Sphingomonas telluris TaxID=2907998 RepID=A0ABS9VLV9_9SPHN|nr:glycoside hydrolase family 9 protein [Sphingomonas telluris]MCH8615945.1 glycoside hydrolase family 9 protein [Sphingomonas telluris]